jgi:1,4-alpha-glucan branching enzyme
MGEVRPTSPGPVKPYGPRQIADNVLFVANFPQAKSVQLAGDFNNWKPEKNPMTKAVDGTWQARIPLAKGTYRYRFVVDGKWQHDPHNSSTESNPYGELNSVFKVI